MPNPFWRATLFFKVSLLRMLISPLSMALNAIPRLMNSRLGSKLSTRILSHIYGGAIPYPFLKPEWLGSFQREELVRVYLLSIGRDRGRPVESDRPPVAATNQITWMIPDSQPIGCPHGHRQYFQVLHCDNFRCEICDERQTRRIHYCSLCYIKMCSGCKGDFLSQHHRAVLLEPSPRMVLMSMEWSCSDFSYVLHSGDTSGRSLWGSREVASVQASR